MLQVKITVLRKYYYPDLAKEYLTDGEVVGSCSLLNEGDEFVYKGSAVMPEGFCPWAWMDIYRGVSSLSAGGTYKPWNINDGQQILCCTDGVRPVVFRLDALHESDGVVE
jgi:uncharacterized repeat protein (TIGR04076 family)